MVSFVKIGASEAMKANAVPATLPPFVAAMVLKISLLVLKNIKKIELRRWEPRGWTEHRTKSQLGPWCIEIAKHV